MQQNNAGNILAKLQTANFIGRLNHTHN